jgi:type IV secretory pathway VirB2 component (pilin)
VKLSKADVVVAALVIAVCAVSPAFAATDPWSNFFTLIKDWITGNLGKFLALLSVTIGAGWTLITHRFQPLAWSVIIAVVLGGAVGLAKLFFSAGGDAFGTSW